jgi:thioredoxin-like negative regulator of GroEL
MGDARHPPALPALPGVAVVAAAVSAASTCCRDGSALAWPVAARSAPAASATAPASAHTRLAEGLFGSGREGDGVTAALAALRAARGDDAARDREDARALLLAAFDWLGPEHPAVESGRRALSKALFR